MRENVSGKQVCVLGGFPDVPSETLTASENRPVQVCFWVFTGAEGGPCRVSAAAPFRLREKVQPFQGDSTSGTPAKPTEINVRNSVGQKAKRNKGTSRTGGKARVIMMEPPPLILHVGAGQLIEA